MDTGNGRDTGPEGAGSSPCPTCRDGMCQSGLGGKAGWAVRAWARNREGPVWVEMPEEGNGVVGRPGFLPQLWHPLAG